MANGCDAALAVECRESLENSVRVSGTADESLIPLIGHTVEFEARKQAKIGVVTGIKNKWQLIVVELEPAVEVDGKAIYAMMEDAKEYIFEAD